VKYAICTQTGTVQCFHSLSGEVLTGLVNELYRSTSHSGRRVAYAISTSDYGGRSLTLLAGHQMLANNHAKLVSRRSPAWVHSDCSRNGRWVSGLGRTNAAGRWWRQRFLEPELSIRREAAVLRTSQQINIRSASCRKICHHSLRRFI